MKLFLEMANFIVPFVIFGIVTYGVLMHVNVYDTFIKGARNGFFTVIKIMPTLIGLMIAVGILRTSGFLDFLSELVGRFSGVPRNMHRTIHILYRFSGRISTAYGGKDVFFFGGNRTAAGYFQRIRNGFLYWSDRIHQYVLHRNYFLYNECILYDS